MHSTWLNSWLWSKNLIYYFSTFFDADARAVPAHPSCTSMAWHWHVTCPGVAGRCVENFVCFRAPDGAEGPWRASNVAWSHSGCLSHRLPGVHHSITVRFQLKMEIAGLLGSKMAFMQCGQSEPGKGWTKKLCIYQCRFALGSSSGFTHTSISLPENGTWLIILATYIWQLYFLPQGCTLRVML